MVGTPRKRITLALTAFALAACAPAATVNQQTAMPMDAATLEMRANTSLSWGDMTPPGFSPGMKIAVLHGDPGASGDYTIRLSFPDGYRFPAHWHPGGEHVTVLSGTFLLSMVTTGGVSAERAYVPGDFLYIPGRNPHSGGASGATVIQLHGIGPFAINLGTP